MGFVYDKAKSDANLEKHGIDFEEAQLLWDDPNLMEFRIEFKGELRIGAMARYAGSCWVAITAPRGNDVRIISVRRATKKEMSLYDKARNDR